MVLALSIWHIILYLSKFITFDIQVKESKLLSLVSYAKRGINPNLYKTELYNPSCTMNSVSFFFFIISISFNKKN